MAASRKDSFFLQVIQITDAFLVWIAFWLAGLMRGPLREWLELGPYEDEPLSQMAWVLYIAVHSPRLSSNASGSTTESAGSPPAPQYGS